MEIQRYWYCQKTAARTHWLHVSESEFTTRPWNQHMRIRKMPSQVRLSNYCLNERYDGCMWRQLRHEPVSIFWKTYLVMYSKPFWGCIFFDKSKSQCGSRIDDLAPFVLSQRQWFCLVRAAVLNCRLALTMPQIFSAIASSRRFLRFLVLLPGIIDFGCYMAMDRACSLLCCMTSNQGFLLELLTVSKPCLRFCRGVMMELLAWRPIWSPAWGEEEQKEG